MPHRKLFEINSEVVLGATLRLLIGKVRPNCGQWGSLIDGQKPVWSLGLVRWAGRGSLTRRCGRGESAIEGRAAGFRVGHREGHWTRHRGGRRQ